MFQHLASSIRGRLVLCVYATSLVLGGGALQGADLSGSWSGYWVSDSTGHKGPLRCNFMQLDNGSYQANFSGRFFKILPFRYSVVLDVVQDGDTLILAGDHELGRRLGVFHYDAQATDQEFVANYTSCKDQGRFVLSRCCCN